MTGTIETITTAKTNHYYLRALVALAVVASLLVVLAAKPAHASTTFTVNSPNDFLDANTADGVCNALASGGPECTLRAAIQQANATPGADTINFNIPGSDVQTISPKSGLPDLEITERVTIDGYTQPGASPNTLAQGTNAVLKIRLDGINTNSNGLVISSGGSGSVIKGLAINRFGNDGIATVGSNQNRIEGNFIGTFDGDTLDRGNAAQRLAIFDSTSSTVGGTTPDKRNLISGNNQNGILIEDTGGDANNFNRVEGNLIGTNKDGTTALGNSQNGVGILDSSSNTVSSNTIAFNSKDGVAIVAGSNSDSANANIVLGNSIFSNTEQGIDLNADGITANDGDNPNTGQVDPDSDTGPNALQNFPVLTSAKTTRKGTTITGKLNSTPNKAFIVQFFSNASGGDEGQKPIGQVGVTTDGNGNASFSFKPAQKVGRGQKITATATDSSALNTSEFSAAKKVVRKR